MMERLYPLHHQDAHLSYTFDNKGHIHKQYPIFSNTYKYSLVQKRRQ